MKRWVRTALHLLSLLLFGFILWRAGPGVWQQVWAGDPKHILTAFLLLAAATALSATRLQLVAHSLAGRRLASWHSFYYLTTTTRAAGLVVPRSLSTFAGKPIALHSLGLPLKRSLWAVLLDNLFDLALLGTLAIPSLLFLGDRLSHLAVLGVALGLTLALTGGVWYASGRSVPLRLRKWVKRISRIKAIRPSGLDEPTLLMPPRSAALRALALTVLLDAALATCYHSISRSVGLSYSWPLFAAGFSAVQLSLVLAVTPGGLGIFDAGWYGVLLLGGVPKRDALAFVVAQRAYTLVFVLICAGIGALLPVMMRGSEHG